MSLIVDRSALLQASWSNTIRLARWIGAKRLPTCGCPGCRALVIGALDRYLQERPWAAGKILDRGIDACCAQARPAKRRRSRSVAVQAHDS
jgi:hypothetical protein